MTTMRQHIDSLLQASLAVEQGLRQQSCFSKDRYPTADAETTSIFDAAAQKTGRRGFALLLSDDGKAVEVVPIGNVEASLAAPNSHGFSEWSNPGPSESHRANTKKMVEESQSEPYTQMGEHHFESAKTESHKPSKRGEFEPMNLAKHNPVGDAVVRMRAEAEQRKAKQAQAKDTRAMRRFAQDQYAKNESFAEAQKAFWEKKSA